MKYILWAFLLLSASAFAQQQPVYCNAGNQIACNTSSQQGSGVQGDPAWKAFGKVNANEAQLYNTDSSANLEVTTSVYCGAVVNTSSDSGPCIQAALTAAASQNRCAHLAGGTYSLQSRINWPSNGACLKGDGWNIATPGVGTWIHVVSANFMSGGSQFGNQPIQIGSSAAVNNVWIDSIAFTEDQPADSGGWTPNNYGPMIIVANGSIAPKFTNLYIAGVNYFLDLHSIEGAFIDHVFGQAYTTAVQIDHNADWMHVAHVHFNDFFCSITNCPNITAYEQSHTTIFQSNRNDSPTWIDTQAFGVLSLFSFGTDATGVTTEFTISGADCDKCQQTMLVSGVGVNGKSYGLLAHGDNFAGSASLSNSNLINIAATSTGDVLQFSDLRCEYTGDSCITDLGSSNTVILGGSFYAVNWGSNSTNGACSTIFALAANNTSSSNTLQGNPNAWAFSPTCSSLTFSTVTAGPLFGTTINAGAGGFTVTAAGQVTSTAILTVPKITLSGASCSSVGVGICPSSSNTLNFIAGATNSGDIDLHQHWSVGSAASATISSGACGTGTNGTVTGNDHSGLITIGAASTATCVLTFSATYATAPRSVSLTPANSTAASSTTAFVSAVATGSFTISGTLASTSWYYWVQ